MSQEHRFCAEIYARLFPLIDRSRQIVISPDGQAKLPGHDGLAPPDLCFTLCGIGQQLRIEAKIVKDVRDVTLQASQLAWCLSDDAVMKPHLWMIATRDLDRCWWFDHREIAQRVRAKSGRSTPLNLWPGINPPAGCGLDELALGIVAWATKNLVDTAPPADNPPESGILRAGGTDRAKVLQQPS